MNLYLLFILTFLIGVFFLDTLADLLNLSRLNGELPQEFQGIYDSGKYLQSLKYQRENVYFDLVHRTVDLWVSIPFILLGGFNTVDTFSRSFGLSYIPTGLIFVGTLSFLRFFIEFPFSIYSTFVLEAKFGFNKTTLKTFFQDLIKGTLIGAILGGFIFSGIVYFFENAGPHAWLFCWIAVTLFQFILLYLAPVVILPLFNKFEPLPEGLLKQAIENYAKTQKFALNGIFTMDSSKRSTKSNAFFTGFGRFRRLVLFDTLIAKQSIEELVAVLAHEIGHFKEKHIIKSLILSILTMGVIFYTFHLFINNTQLFEAFQMTHTSVYASIVFVGFLYSPLFRILSLFTQKLSRKHEFEADAYAIHTYGNPEILISALKKLSVDNLSHLTPHPLKVALDYSHPPILERIYALRKK